MSEQTYPTYKPSGLVWLEDIPEHWLLIRLKYCADLNMGQSPSSEDVSLDKEGIPFLQGNADFGNLNPTPKYYCRNSKKIAKKDDILLSVRAPVGALNIADQIYCIGRGLCALRFRPEFIDNNFSWYLLQNAREQLKLETSGSTYDAVATEDVANIILIVPPLPEQLSIAKFLDREATRIDKLIEKKQKQIELLQEKRSALISHVVTKGLDPNVKMKNSGIDWLGEVPEHWEIVKIKRVSKINNGSTPKSSISEYWDGDINWVTPEDLGNLKNHTIYETRRKISEKGYLSCGTTIVPEGSIVLSTRAPIGHIAIAGNPLCCNQGCRLLTINENQNNKYFYYLLYICKSALESYGQGSTFMELSRNNLESFVISVPPIQEQNVIVNLLDNETSQIDNLIDRIEFSIEKIQEYRTSLISAAVTGKIDVRDEVSGTDTDDRVNMIAAESVEDYNK